MMMRRRSVMMMMVITAAAAALVLIHSVNSFALKEKRGMEERKKLQCCLAQGNGVEE